MALKDYQQEIFSGRLYETTIKGGVSGKGNTLNPSIWANGAISLYGSESATQPAALADMTLDDENTDVSGNLVLAQGVSVVPRYLAFTGSATEIVATGIQLIDLGAIS